MDIKDLHNKFLECNSIVDIDSRSIRNGSIFFAIKGDNFDGNQFAQEALNKGAKFAVIDSNSIDIDDSKILRVKDSLETLQKLSTFHRIKTNSTVVALTGSNGKTTTKELIDCVLSSNFKTISTKGNYNNHIGVPLSLLQIEDDTEYSIIELGANNFGEIDFLTKITLPDYGYITNFGNAHLEGFIDIEGVIKAKTELLSFGLANITAEALNTKNLTTNLKGNLFYSLDQKIPVGIEVTKNKLTRLALKDTKYQHMDEMFRGPTAIGSSEDPVMAAKVLVNFANENEKLVIIGGGLEDKSLSKDDVVALAKLPSLNDLRGKLVGLLQAPASKIARLTKEPASKVLRTISQKSQQQ